jgi:DNA anti-recombination protein RmuC
MDDIIQSKLRTIHAKVQHLHQCSLKLGSALAEHKKSLQMFAEFGKFVRQFDTSNADVDAETQIQSFLNLLIAGLERQYWNRPKPADLAKFGRDVENLDQYVAWYTWCVAFDQSKAELQLEVLEDIEQELERLLDEINKQLSKLEDNEEERPRLCDKFTELIHNLVQL